MLTLPLRGSASASCEETCDTDAAKGHRHVNAELRPRSWAPGFGSLGRAPCGRVGADCLSRRGGEVRPRFQYSSSRVNARRREERPYETLLDSRCVAVSAGMGPRRPGAGHDQGLQSQERRQRRERDHRASLRCSAMAPVSIGAIAREYDTKAVMFRKGSKGSAWSGAGPIRVDPRVDLAVFFKEALEKQGTAMGLKMAKSEAGAGRSAAPSRTFTSPPNRRPAPRCSTVRPGCSSRSARPTVRPRVRN